MTAREKARELTDNMGNPCEYVEDLERFENAIERALLDTIEEAAQKAKSPCNCGQCETCAWHNDIAAEIRKMKGEA